jgi:hypothetical protein
MKRLALTLAGASLLAVTLTSATHAQGKGDWSFQRVGTFLNFDNAPVTEGTVSEIVAATPDGRTLIYTDAERGTVGFIDITDPSRPAAAGALDLEPVTGPNASPTSVAVLRNQYILVAVDTSASKKQASGELQVIDVRTREVVATLDLGGQPDSVKVSPDHRFIAVAIENERDETLCVGSTCAAGGGRLGGMPQDPLGNPPGFLAVIATGGAPSRWTVDHVSLENLPGARFASDPEPEFVDINGRNEAVVTLQENNHVVIVDLPGRRVLSHFSAGSVTVGQIDTVRAGSGVPNTIAPVNTQVNRLREPDAVAWVGDRIATANEGDYDGGSRGFTIFARDGSVVFDSGNSLEHLAIRHGHYPERRSNSKGTEPEAIAYAKYGPNEVLFVNSERGSFVSVYRLDRDGLPSFWQLLPAPAGPEGLLAIPQRNLLVSSGEVDGAIDGAPFGVRSSVQIYELKAGAPTYPQIYSAATELLSGNASPTPVPWGALSGLTEVPDRPGRLQAVWDSFYTPTRIFTIDVTQSPAAIVGAETVAYLDGRNFPDGNTRCNTAAACYDPEGLAYAPDETLWIASEGNASDSRPNRLLRTARVNGVLEVVDEVRLPAAVDACRAAEFALSQSADPPPPNGAGTLGSGFEGLDIVPAEGGKYRIYAAQQRGWNFTQTLASGLDCNTIDDDPNDLDGAEPTWTRIWVYEFDPATQTGTWLPHIPYQFQPKPADAAWIGLSEITYTPEGWILIERDNLTGSFPTPAGAATPNNYKTLVRIPLDPGSDGFYASDDKSIFDLRPSLLATNGYVTDKPEGVGVLSDGDLYVVTDNDGVDGSSGETWFLRLGAAWKLFQ